MRCPREFFRKSLFVVRREIRTYGERIVRHLQTPFGNAIRETPFCGLATKQSFEEARSQTEFGNERQQSFEVVRSQTEFGNEKASENCFHAPRRTDPRRNRHHR